MKCNTNLCKIDSFTGRKTLMRCKEQLEEKVMVHLQYSSSERGKAGMFRLQVLLDFFLFSMISWLSSDQSRTKELHKKIAIKTS